MVERLIESPLDVVSVVCPSEWSVRLEALMARRPLEIPLHVVEKKELEKLTGFKFYQGVMATARMPLPVEIDQVLKRAGSSLLILAMEGVSGPENVGALVRSAAAFGATAILQGETTASPFLRRAVRSSMGAVFNLPIVKSSSLQDDLQRLKAGGVRCVAAHPRAEALSLPAADFGNDVCIVMGSEGDGLTQGVLSLCDVAASIPMAGTVDSLNVGNAGAVFLYEAWRQRQ